MLKRLERDATKADLAAVNALLRARTQDEDPIGYLQFSQRVEELNQRLREIDDTPSTNAEVGLFFGGRPVLGSRGIQADFGAKAVAEFQALLSNAFAASDGGLGSRGPVRQRDRSQMMLTDVARGSFGFVLEHLDDAQLVDSAMKDVVSHTVDLIFRISSPDQEAFESLAEEVDSRVLGSLKAFFKTLDDAGATMRIVEDRRDFTLHREDIGLARERTESVTFHEEPIEEVGILYILPDARRFELHPIQGGDTIKGAIAPECLAQISYRGAEVRPGVIGSIHTVILKVREFRATGQTPKKSYTLLSLRDQGDSLSYAASVPSLD